MFLQLSYNNYYHRPQSSVTPIQLCVSGCQVLCCSYNVSQTNCQAQEIVFLRCMDLTSAGAHTGHNGSMALQDDAQGIWWERACIRNDCSCTHLGYLLLHTDGNAWDLQLPTALIKSCQKHLSQTSKTLPNYMSWSSGLSWISVVWSTRICRWILIEECDINSVDRESIIMFSVWRGFQIIQCIFRFDDYPYHGKTAVVVGAGPAGTTCALLLAEQGFNVQVNQRTYLWSCAKYVQFSVWP